VGKAIEDEGRRRGRTEDAVKFLIVLVIVVVLGPVVRKAIEDEGRRRGRTEDAVKFLIVLVIVFVLGSSGEESNRGRRTTTRTN